ncbi:hypothetical protein DICA1_D01420 [Diutina catenulata]
MKYLVPPKASEVLGPTSSFASYGPKPLNHPQWKSKGLINSGFPRIPYDIRGLDANASNWLFSDKRLLRSEPFLSQTMHFGLQYFPEVHPIARYRKSLVSLVFTLRGSQRLNNKEMEMKFSSYRGKYCNLTYFSTSQKPNDSAFSRTAYKKLIRSALYEAIQTLPQSQQRSVQGVFRLQYHQYPTSNSEIAMIHRDVQFAINKLVNHRLQNSLVNKALNVNAIGPRAQIFSVTVPRKLRLPYFRQKHKV